MGPTAHSDASREENFLLLAVIGRFICYQAPSLIIILELGNVIITDFERLTHCHRYARNEFRLPEE